MAYPKTIINRAVRRIFFFTLVMIFFISAPIMIMYSIGYRYDWATKQILETGVISIDVYPTDAEVYLSDVKINKKIPIRLTNRAPGTYNLRIEKIGYKKWEKNIDVKSKQTTYIKNVSLLRDTLPVLTFTNTEKNIQSIYPSANGNYILLASKKDNFEVLELFNTNTKEVNNILNLPAKTEYRIEWSPFDNHLMIINNRTETVAITMLSADNQNNLKTYTIKRDNYNNHFQWQKNSVVPIVFTRDNDYLIKITLNNYERLYKIDTADLWYIDSQEKLWLNKNNLIYLQSSNEPRENVSIPNNENITKIIDINETRIILQSDRNLIVVFRSNNKSEILNATALIYNSGTKEWLAWSPWELWSIYEENKPALFNRTSDNIISVFPLDEVGALLVVNNHGLTAFNPGYYVSQQLFNGEIKQVLVNQKIKTIYFLGKVGEKEGLFELEY